MPGTRRRSRATGATSTRRLLSSAGGKTFVHDGEEAGLGQWRTAREKAGDPGGWTVHAPGS